VSWILRGGRVGVLPEVSRTRRSDVASTVAVGHEIPTDCRFVMSSLMPSDRSPLSELQALLLESTPIPLLRRAGRGSVTRARGVDDG
jgi:hypothetical protein